MLKAPMLRSTFQQANNHYVYVIFPSKQHKLKSKNMLALT